MALSPDQKQRAYALLGEYFENLGGPDYDFRRWVRENRKAKNARQGKSTKRQRRRGRRTGVAEQDMVVLNLRGYEARMAAQWERRRLEVWRAEGRLTRDGILRLRN